MGPYKRGMRINDVCLKLRFCDFWCGVEALRFGVGAGSISLIFELGV